MQTFLNFTLLYLPFAFLGIYVSMKKAIVEGKMSVRDICFSLLPVANLFALCAWYKHYMRNYSGPISLSVKYRERILSMAREYFVQRQVSQTWMKEFAKYIKVNENKTFQLGPNYLGSNEHVAQMLQRKPHVEVNEPDPFEDIPYFLRVDYQKEALKDPFLAFLFQPEQQHVGSTQ